MDAKLDAKLDFELDVKMDGERNCMKKIIFMYEKMRFAIRIRKPSYST